MADIYQCPRCGAITYRHGIKIHDADHAARDVVEGKVEKLEERVGKSEGFELRNWPQDGEAL